MRPLCSVDGDSLDNRKINLKRVTNRENALNSSRHDNAVGMTFNKREQKWKAYINLPTGKKHLGTFKTEEEASNAVREARKQCP